MSPAVTNRRTNTLLLVIRSSLEHPVMQKMLKISKISENDTIEDILFSDEWQEFAKNLERNLDKVVPTCITHCKKRTNRDRQKIEEII